MTSETIQAEIREALRSTWDTIDRTGGVERNDRLANYAVALGRGLEAYVEAVEMDGRWGCFVCDEVAVARSLFIEAQTYLNTNVAEEAVLVCDRFQDGCGNCGRG